MAAQTDSLTYSVDMRGEGPQRLALVQLDSVRAVQVRDVIVRVHGYQDVCHIRLERIKNTIRVTAEKVSNTAPICEEDGE